MNIDGLIVGCVSFAAIGLFHPIVIKGEYHFGVRIWPLFVAVGLACLVASCLTPSVRASAILAVVGFSSLWSVGELFKQRERVRKGWFPANPKRVDSARRKNTIAGVLCLVVTSLATSLFATSLTDPATFLSRYVDTSRPGLTGVPAKLAMGDLRGAEADFAAHVRTNLACEAVTARWKNRKITPEQRAKLVARAKRIMGYELTASGFPHQFPIGRVAWESNPTYNGYVEWQYGLARHYDMTALAEYYFLTKDEHAAEVWAQMVLSFIEQTTVPPIGTGPFSTKCWRTIDTAERIKEWIRQIHVFVRSPVATDDFLTRYFASVREHGWRIRNCYSVVNWLIIEFEGLVAMAGAFPFLSESSDWYNHAMTSLRKELDRQVYPDGFQFELTSGYNGVVIGCCLGILDYHDLFGLPRPEFLVKKLDPMFAIYLKLMCPDRHLPALNDGGRDGSLRWFRSALALNPDHPEYVWLLSDGKKGVAPAFLSCALENAGMAIFRNSWQRDAVWGFLDAGPFGQGGHQHEDKLNFLLFAYGREMLTDPGNFNYDTSEMRKYVISTRGHNTVMFDSLEQNRRKNLATSWPAGSLEARAKDFSFALSPACETAEGCYDEGYGPDLTRFTHKRRVLFVKDRPEFGPFFVVIDRFFAPDAAPHAYEALWHLETSRLTLGMGQFTADFGKGVSLHAAFSDPSATLADRSGTYQPRLQGWMPIWGCEKHEHRKIPTPVVSGTFTTSRRVVTVFVPAKDRTPPLAGVTASPDISANTLTINLTDGRSFSLSEVEVKR